jgi:hypothetical protein
MLPSCYTCRSEVYQEGATQNDGSRSSERYRVYHIAYLRRRANGFIFLSAAIRNQVSAIQTHCNITELRIISFTKQNKRREIPKKESCTDLYG